MKSSLRRLVLILAAALTVGGLAGCSKGGDKDPGHGEKGHAHGEEGGDKDPGHGEKGHAHGEKGEEKGHADGEKGEEKGHADDEKGHADGEKGEEKGHADGEKGEEGHGEEGHEGHEEGVVVLSPAAAAQAKIRVAPVEQRAVSFTFRTTARVDFDERKLAHVSPRITGRVQSVRAELGDQVKAGQVLATLDSIDLGQAKAEYLAARAEESVARKTREREESLLKEKITSEQSVLEARAAHEKALASLRSAEERLRLLGLGKDQIQRSRHGDPSSSHFPLTAPIDGKIVEKHLVVGETVAPEEKVFTVADLGRLWIWIDVYERNLARIHPGDVVTVVTEAYPGRTFQGAVTYIRDQVDPDTRTARARIDIENPDGALKPGMFAEVMVTDPHAKDGGAVVQSLAVPPSAVQRDGEKLIAFVQEGERRYERREVRVGMRTEQYVEVLEGLAAGEPVVVDGAFVLKSEAAKEEMGGGHSH
jgi:cobalt-zinc-cadmium efflux system membrane fusion protein